MSNVIENRINGSYANNRNINNKCCDFDDNYVDGDDNISNNSNRWLNDGTAYKHA